MKLYAISITLLLCCISFYAFSQTATLSGYVSGQKTGERLTGATVYAPALNVGTSCNDFGFYSLTLPKGEVKIACSFVGFDVFTTRINLVKDTVLDIRMASNNLLSEVKVHANSGNNFSTSQSLSRHRLNAKEIEKIPAILGEPDVLKALQLLPGVSFATEGATGFSVRGGSPDQTLIRLDGVPVYNVNHLWGFLSAFNNDAIKESKLYSGNLPARLGGRLSSVLDVSMKEGNLKKRTGSFSLSPIAGRYMLEGPIVKDKASYMISVRKTWADVLLWAGRKIEDVSEVLTYGFGDINAKTNWIVNHNNRIFLSFYSGRDAYKIEDGDDDNDGWKNDDYCKFVYSWQNITGVLRWNHIFSSSLFANFSVYNSRFRQEYNNRFGKKSNSDYYKGYNNLNDFSVNADFNWILNPSTEFLFGYQLSAQKFSPEIISCKADTSIFSLNKDVFTRNFITDVYFEGNIDLLSKLKANVGLRFGNIRADTKNYLSIRPRLSLRYLFRSDLWGEISYSRMKQFLQQLQNTTLGIPTEMWVSSTRKVKPGSSDLFSSGISWCPENKYKLSAEIYYSKFKSIVRYKEGTRFLKEDNESWDDYVAIGEGRSYGLELMAEKQYRKFRGWIAYTLSKSTRQFDAINNGHSFPYMYDRRHQLKMNVNYSLSQKIKKGKNIKNDISATFNYASGRYVSLALQEYQGIMLPLMNNKSGNYDWFFSRPLQNETNNYRLPSFHNLNVSYRIERKSKDKTVSWNFSVYNIYNRLNPWYYYKRNNKLRQISIFPIIPSVSFTYKW